MRIHTKQLLIFLTVFSLMFANACTRKNSSIVSLATQSSCDCYSNPGSIDLNTGTGCVEDNQNDPSFCVDCPIGIPDCQAYQFTGNDSNGNPTCTCQSNGCAPGFTWSGGSCTLTANIPQQTPVSSNSVPPCSTNGVTLDGCTCCQVLSDQSINGHHFLTDGPGCPANLTWTQEAITSETGPTTVYHPTELDQNFSCDGTVSYVNPANFNTNSSNNPTGETLIGPVYSNVYYAGSTCTCGNSDSYEDGCCYCTVSNQGSSYVYSSNASCPGVNNNYYNQGTYYTGAVTYGDCTVNNQGNSCQICTKISPAPGCINGPV